LLGGQEREAASYLWRNAVMCVCKNYSTSPSPTSHTTTFPLPPSRKFIAIVNPNSGSGAAMAIYNYTVKLFHFERRELK